MSRTPQLKPGAFVVFMLLIFTGTYCIVSCNKSEPKVYDDFVTESLEVTYQNGDVDTVEVRRNSEIPYSLLEGDLKVCDREINENSYRICNKTVKCGVRDFKVIGD